MPSYEIPLKPYAQHLSIPINGITYQLTVRWNIGAAVWVVDIADLNGNKILSGIPLVTGIDLLGQYQYLKFGASLHAFTDGNVTAPPTYENLGILGHVYFTVN